MPEQKNQNLVWIKGEIKKKQLAFILDDCFSTNELTKLVEDCFSGFLEVNLALAPNYQLKTIYLLQY